LNPGHDILDFDAEESFDIIERELLRCLVLSGQSSAADLYRKQPLDCLRVGLAEGIVSAELQFSSRDNNNNLVWDKAVNADSESFPDLRFFDFFDWRHYGSIDYDYVRAIETGTRRLVLVPQKSCSFWLIQPQGAGD
jgi:hypothetical protein